MLFPKTLMPPVVWYSLKLISIISESDTVRRFLFKWDGDKPADFIPGQFLVCDLPIGEKRIQRWRSYSIAGKKTYLADIEFCISYKPDGPASDYFFKTIQADDTIRVKAPEGNFVLPDNKDQHVFLICTGTGLAPFRAMIHELMNQDKPYRSVHLIFGTRTKNDLLYKEEFQGWISTIPNFRISVCLSRDNEIPAISAVKYYPKAYVHKVYNELLEQDPELIADSTFMICGWSEMIDECLAHLLVQHKVDRSKLRYELYG